MLNLVEHEHHVKTPFMARRRRQKHSLGCIPTADDENKPHEDPLQSRLSLKESRVIKCDAKIPSSLSWPLNLATIRNLLLTGLLLLATDRGGYYCSRTEVTLPATHVWQDPSRTEVLLLANANHSSNVGGNSKEGGSSRKSQPLLNSADNSSNVEDSGKEGGSSRKIALAVPDQYVSVDKPEYALAAMLKVFFGLSVSLLELHNTISKEKARWRWDKGIPWFYCPTATPSTYRLFGDFANIFGLLSAILQSMKAAADYFLYIQHSVNPIRFNFWSIFFAICGLCSHFVEDLRQVVFVLHQTDKNV